MAKHRTTEQQLAAAEAQLNKLREKARKEQTRRKILIGSMLLSRAERDPAAHAQLMRDLDGWLTADRDRRLFDLGPIRGLYGATLKLSGEQPKGWSMGVVLAEYDRYGNRLRTTNGDNA